MVKSLTSLIFRWRIVLHDMLVIPIAWLGAYWLRYNLETIPDIFWQGAIFSLPAVVTVQAVVNIFVGVHRGEWRFVSLADLSLIVRAVVIGAGAIAISLFVVAERLAYVPRSVLFFISLCSPY